MGNKPGIYVFMWDENIKDMFRLVAGKVLEWKFLSLM